MALGMVVGALDMAAKVSHSLGRSCHPGWRRVPQGGRKSLLIDGPVYGAEPGPMPAEGQKGSVRYRDQPRGMGYPSTKPHPPK